MTDLWLERSTRLKGPAGCGLIVLAQPINTPPSSSGSESSSEVGKQVVGSCPIRVHLSRMPLAWALVRYGEVTLSVAVCSFFSFSISPASLRFIIAYSLCGPYLNIWLRIGDDIDCEVKFDNKSPQAVNKACEPSSCMLYCCSCLLRR